jgi:hypothetical protein
VRLDEETLCELLSFCLLNNINKLSRSGLTLLLAAATSFGLLRLAKQLTEQHGAKPSQESLELMAALPTENEPQRKRLQTDLQAEDSPPSSPNGST